MQGGGLKATLRSWVQRPPEPVPTDSDLHARLIHEAERHSHSWFWQTDRQGRIDYLSAKIATIFTDAGIDPVGMPLSDLLRIAGDPADAQEGGERTIAFHLSARTPFTDYAVCPVGGPDAHSWTVSGSPFCDRFGRFEGFVGSGSDDAAIRSSDAAITRLALFDSLTGLANRQRLRRSLDQALEQGGYAGTGLLLLDLDRFKAVNDTLGHPTGDALLQQVARRLLQVVGDAGLVGRLGGDEFQVVLPRTADQGELATLAQAIIATLSQPYFLNGASVSIGCSIGIAVSPDHGTCPDTLIASADLALYDAKDAGRGVHRFFRDALRDHLRSRSRLEQELRGAIAGDQMRIMYQPVVATRDGSITGFEALVRWQHPVHGTLQPADFVGIAEECGLIEAIGEWVLRTACADAATWPGEPRLSVNIAATQLDSPALPAIVTNALARAGLQPDRLELDVAEAAVLRDMTAATARCAALKAIGVRIALNDFGAGQASLNGLRRLPFDRIKIDRSFVRGVVDIDGLNAAAIRAITTLAGALGIDTTAKGVEYHDEANMIRALGCTDIQGFVYGAPVATAAAAARLLATGAAEVGLKSSRAQRTRMLRAAAIEIDGQRRQTRIRDLSTTGAQIDAIDFGEDQIGSAVRIDVGDGEWVSSTIRWAGDGRAGLQFLSPIVVDRRTTARRKP